MSTKTTTEPVLDEAPACWPPVAHLIRKEDRPCKPGTIALCGAKMMGHDLDSADVRRACPKCLDAAAREMAK